MTSKYRTKAFIFQKNNINETDRVFSVFTDDFGHLNIFAKAIRKITSKLRNGIDIFFLSEIEFIQGKNRKTLTDASVIKKFNNIFQSPEKFRVAYKIGEILSNFIKGEEKDQRLFDLLEDSFHRLDDNNLSADKCNLVYQYFLWNAFSLLGYKSEVNICAICHKKLIPNEVYFSGEEGGIICKICLGKDIQILRYAKKINSDIVKILRIILLKDWHTLSKLKISINSQKLLDDVSKDATNAFCPTGCYIK